MGMGAQRRHSGLWYNLTLKDLATTTMKCDSRFSRPSTSSGSTTRSPYAENIKANLVIQNKLYDYLGHFSKKYGRLRTSGRLERLLWRALMTTLAGEEETRIKHARIVSTKNALVATSFPALGETVKILFEVKPLG
jgi:hypothetical protein